MKPRHALAVFGARNREFVRDRSALVWTVVFPFVLVFGFAFAFSGGMPEQYVVGVLGDVDDARDLVGLERVEYVEVTDLDMGMRQVQRHSLHLLVDPEQRRYWMSDASSGGYLLERALHGAEVDDATGNGWQREVLAGDIVRYVDWLLPGLLAMNMMFTALFGVGFVIVRYRKNGVLKRLSATPLTPMEFLVGQLGSRLLILIVVTTGIFVGCHALIGFPVHGSYVTLILVYLLGAVCLIALALIVAARTASEELAGGLINLMVWPMMLLSGVWFSIDALHPWLQEAARILPLTHVIGAARAVMLDGAGMVAIAPQLGVLMGMTVAFLAVGAGLFRWE